MNPYEEPQEAVQAPPMTAPPATSPKHRTLSRQQVFNKADVRIEFEPVPEWAPDDATPEERAEFGVYLHGMTARERDTFETDQLEFGKRVTTKVDFFRNFRATLVSRCTFDENGERLFGDVDIPWLGNKSAIVVSRLSDKIRDLSGMTADDVEALAKNSETDQSDSSPTGSLPLLGTPA